MSYFSVKLITLRNLNGMTQEQFAKKLGISRSSVGMYELAEREPPFKTLEKMSMVLNVTPGILLGSYKQDEEVDKIISDYIKLDDVGRYKIRKLLDELLNRK